MSEAQSSTMRAMSAPTIAKRGKASSHDVAGCSLRLSCGVRIRASDLMGWGATLVGFSRGYLGAYDEQMDYGDEENQRRTKAIKRFGDRIPLTHYRGSLAGLGKPDAMAPPAHFHRDTGNDRRPPGMHAKPAKNFTDD